MKRENQNINFDITNYNHIINLVPYIRVTINTKLVVFAHY